MENTLDHKTIVNHLLKHHGSKNIKELVLKMSKLLDLTETSIYNKLQNRTNFTAVEILQIFSFLNMSVDEFIQDNTKYHGFVPYHADGLKYKPRNYSDYINNIIYYYTKVKQLPNAMGYFLANEVPLSHLLNFPHLTYLKFYIWNRTNWKIEGISMQYDSKTIQKDEELKHAIFVLKQLFSSFSNTEIWHPQMLDNSLSQYQYLKSIGVIHLPEDIEAIGAEFNGLVDYLESLTLSGLKPANSKGEQKECNVYFTELNIGSEVILVRSDELSLLFQQIDVPNYMRTSNAKMIEHQQLYFENIKNISTHITKTGEIARYRYMQILRNKIHDVFDGRS